MYFPDKGCVHTLLTLYVYATGHHQGWSFPRLFDCSTYVKNLCSAFHVCISIQRRRWLLGRHL